MTPASPRPSTRADAKAAILDAAEAAFSEAGFAGAGMKAIALQAGVAQGLLHYHFGNKDGLYEAVIERRALLITGAREALLDEIDMAASDTVPRIFEAFFRPPFGPEGGGRVFARIFALLPIGDARDAALVERFYDPSARKFIDALMAARPDASRETCAWGYAMALSLLVGSVGCSDRAIRLADATLPAEYDTEALIAPLTRHATGGFAALCDGETDRHSRRDLWEGVAHPREEPRCES
ncbi:MAG: TetR/AcrR family transcriptional regulator [Pseudomonadota bacterium]